MVTPGSTCRFSHRVLGDLALEYKNERTVRLAEEASADGPIGLSPDGVLLTSAGRGGLEVDEAIGIGRARDAGIGQGECGHSDLRGAVNGDGRAAESCCVSVSRTFHSKSPL